MLHANIAGKGYSEIHWSDGVLTGIRVLRAEDPAEPYASAGFVDLQVNGMAGVDFGQPQLTAQTVVRTLEPLWASGVTTFCPTVITNSRENLCRAFRVLEEARRLSPEFAQCAPCYHCLLYTSGARPCPRARRTAFRPDTAGNGGRARP